MIPDLEAQVHAKDICTNFIAENEHTSFILDFAIKVIHPNSLGRAKERNKDKLACLKQYAHFLKTEDKENIESQLLDLRKMKKRQLKYLQWFFNSNLLLAKTTSLDSQQDGDTISTPSFCSLFYFIQHVDKFIKKHGNKEDQKK